MKRISYLIIGLALVGLAVAGTLSQQGGIMTWNGNPVIVADENDTLQIESLNLVEDSVYFSGQDNICDNRPLISNQTKTVYVGATREYKTIQSALCDVPLKLNHVYTIRIDEGVYNENIVFGDLQSNTFRNGTLANRGEGLTGGLFIRANTIPSNPEDNNVAVNSFSFYNIHGGTASLYLGGMNITGTDPHSDEAPAIAIYGGSGGVDIHKLNFKNASQQMGVLLYGNSYIYVMRNKFNGQDYAVQIKRFGLAQLGDYYQGIPVNQTNFGYVKDALVSGRSGQFYISPEANHVSAPLIHECTRYGGYEGVVSVMYGNIDICSLGHDRAIELKNGYIDSSLYDSLILDINWEANNSIKVYDNSKNKAHGTVNGMITVYDLNNNNFAGLFDGTNDKLTFNEHRDLLNLGDVDMSWSFWINKTLTNDKRIYSTQNASGGGLTLVTGTSSTNSFRFIKGTTTNDFSWAVPLNQLVHIVITYNTTHATLYVNGTIEQTRAITGTYTLTPEVHIGGSYNDYGAFGGTIDDFKMFTKVLNQREVEALYKKANLLVYTDNRYNPTTYTRNIMYSADGTAWNCQVNNSGVFTCS